MSTVLCIFSTEDQAKRRVLRQRLANLHEKEAGAFFAPVKVLQPIGNDPFLSGRDHVFSNLVAIVKFIVPWGVAMSRYAAELTAAIANLKEDLDDCCHICVTSTRQFKTTDDESVNYLYFMKRRDGFSCADYFDYYANSHFEFGMQTKGITYIQNYIDKSASEFIAGKVGAVSTHFDSVSEMLFSSIDDFFANNNVDDLGGKATADEMKFVDRDMSEMVCCEKFVM